MARPNAAAVNRARRCRCRHGSSRCCGCWPRSIGFFGGIGVAVALGVIEPPLGLFIAAIPLVKMFNHPKLPLPVRVASQMLDGAAKPVGGDAEATIQLNTPEVPATIGPKVEQRKGQ